MDSLQQYHAYKLVISVMYLKWTNFLLSAEMVSFDQIELHIVNKYCTILVEISFFGSHLNKWKNCQKTCQNRYKKNCQKLPKYLKSC